MRREQEQDDVPLSQRLLARPEEAAAMLGVGRSTIYGMLRLGELPVVHIGRSARIPIHALRRWVELHGAPDAADAAGAAGAADAADAGDVTVPQASYHAATPMHRPNHARK